MGEVAKTLISSFLARWTSTSGAVQNDEGLEEALVELWQQGTSAWPGIPLSPLQFATCVAERARTDAPPAVAAREIRAGDLFLACACMHGAPEALRAFDAKLLSRIPIYLGRLDAVPGLADETRRALLDKLFVTEEGRPPKILQYRGRGSLEGWLRVVSLRVAQNLMQSERSRHALIDEAGTVAEAIAPACDPELELMKAGSRDEVVAALREAMASLGNRERALLRFAFVEQMTPARIGSVYGVHRTTAMRWIEAAQGEILARTQARLMTRLRLSPSECESLFHLVKSRIDMTVSSLLKVEP
jgi:RNA polymerase sigma-70 factor (ECF subfamily)